MSRKNNLLKYQTISSGDMSQSSLTSAVTDIRFLDNVGIQLNATGVPVGTFDVQVSADYAQDYDGNVTASGNWISVTLPSTPSVAGAAKQIYIDINQISAPYIRVVYTRTSGTGTLNAFITGKML